MVMVLVCVGEHHSYRTVGLMVWGATRATNMVLLGSPCGFVGNIYGRYRTSLQHSLNLGEIDCWPRTFGATRKLQHPICKKCPWFVRIFSLWATIIDGKHSLNTPTKSWFWDDLGFVSPFLFPKFVDATKIRGKSANRLAYGKPRNPFYAANELGCHPAMRFIVVVDQSCGENSYWTKAAVMGIYDIYGDGSKPISIHFNGMSIHLPAVLWFTRYQGYDS